MKHKVAHVYWQLTFGGIETMLVNIANAQARMDADVTVIIINNLNDKSLADAFHEEVNVIFLHRKPYSKSPAFIIELNRELLRLQPDTIHLHSSKLYKLILIRRLRRKVCVTLHDVPNGPLRRNKLYCLFPFLEYRQVGNIAFMNRISTIFTISNAVRTSLLDIYGIDSIVVTNGIRISDFISRPSRMPDRNRLRIVQVSRLEHVKKGQDLLIEAVSRSGEMIEVDFVGDGSSMGYLKRFAAERGVEKLVRFLGPRSQQWITEHLSRYDLFVQPSRYEGFGLTVAEAMAAHVPVLVSAGQGPAEVTRGDKYGWLFESGDTDDLVRAIRYVFEHYDEVLLKAELAYRYAKNTYDVSITARRYLEEYKRTGHSKG